MFESTSLLMLKVKEAFLRIALVRNPTEAPRNLKILSFGCFPQLTRYSMLYAQMTQYVVSLGEGNYKLSLNEP